MIHKIYKIAPNFIQNILISLFNIIAYKNRYGGKYNSFLEHYKNNQLLSYSELKEIQEKRFCTFVENARNNSEFYKDKYSHIIKPLTLNNISSLPIINKEMLRSNLEKVNTISKSEGIISKTGGTTGKSLEVIFTKQDMQERFAMLDAFRSKFGYKLGERTAWFSGKDLLDSKDLRNRRFWKTDFFYNIRYYSTFHIKQDYLSFYIDNLIKFKPSYIIGFPSSVLEIAKYGLTNNINFPSGIVQAIFPTAESVTDDARETIEAFFKAKIYNQYASSEGAPFILECKNGKLHLEMQSGVFEVLNDEFEQSVKGRLILTSFTTNGTPLIRYDIGDSIELDADNQCTCGNANPCVKEILGRIDDFIYSPYNGKINLGNVSNTLKDVKGVVKFQVIQDKVEELKISMEVDGDEFNDKYRGIFLNNWIDRVGNMKIILNIVDAIESEESGKFRMIKNNIKNLIK